MNEIKELRKKRFEFLHLLYKKSGGNSSNIFMEYDDIGKELGFTEEESDKIYHYLNGEGLIKVMAYGGAIVITHEGVVEIENALSAPEKPSEYFPPAMNIIHVEHMEGSQIQQGSINSTQSVENIIKRGEDLKTFLDLLRNKLPELEISPEDKSEIRSDMVTVDAQLNSSRPKGIIIKESLNSIKKILESAAGGMIATELLKCLLSLSSF
ncbi:MAG: hypothetical protein HY881_03245 [Deltaproteobacteria bacterium]|nr:hypothetical protein [Deltaproteobacteria bacterium]